MKAFLKYILFLAFLILGLSSAKLYSQEPVVVFEEEIYWEWPPTGNLYGGYGFYWWHRNEGIYNPDFGDMSETDWTIPDDFYNGEFLIHFEVLEQPEEEPFFVQMGIWQDKSKGEDTGPITTSDRAYLNGGAGAYAEGSLGRPSGWWNNASDDKVDFSRPEDFYRMGLILWNPEPFCIPAGLEWNSQGCPENASKFFPLRARVKVMAYPAADTTKALAGFTVLGPEGDSIENAEISIFGETLISDSSGQAFIELYPGIYNYSVSGDGFLGNTGSIAMDGEDINETINLEYIPFYTVNFLVKDESGLALENAEVIIADTSLITNSSGRTKLELPDGEYTYSIAKEGFVGFSDTLLVEGTDVTFSISLEEIKVYYTISFYINDEQSYGIQNASILINEDTLTTDINGKATIELTSGNYYYIILKEGFDVLAGTLAVGSSGLTRVVSLQHTEYNLIFIVLDEESNPIENATVKIHDRNLYTGSNGQTVIELINGEYPYIVRKTNFKEYQDTVHIQNESRTENVIMSLPNKINSFSNKITVVPNPENKTLHFLSDKNQLQNIQIDFYTLTGKKLFSKNYYSLPEYISLQNTISENGVYLLTLTMDNQHITNQLIVF